MLSQQNRELAGQEFSRDELVNAKGKNVLVIGGGDTGSDCIGTAHRQGAKSVTQIEIMPKPPVGPDDPKNPWPNWPRTLKTTSSHEEGCVRRWNINSLEFLGKNGKLTGVKVQEPRIRRSSPQRWCFSPWASFVRSSLSSLPTSSLPVTLPQVPVSWCAPWPVVRKWLRKSTKC